MLSKDKIERHLLPALQALEDERILLNYTIKTLFYRKALNIGIAIAFYMGAFLALTNTVVALLLVGIFGLLGLVVFVLKQQELSHKRATQLHTSFTKKIKTEVYQQVFKAWKPTCIYKPLETFPRSTFNQSYLYEKGGSYQGDDFCEGKLEDGRTFQFSEVLVSNTNPEKEPVFKGLFFVIKGPHFLQELDGLVTIRAKKQKEHERIPPNTSSSTAYQDTILDAGFITNPITEEEKSPLFDQLYEIKGKQAAEVRAYIPPKFEEEFNFIRVSLRQAIAVSIESNNIYFAVPNRLNFLAVNLKQPLTNTQNRSYLVQNLERTFELLDCLAAVTTPID